MRRIEISHVTEYLFSSRVSLLPHRLLLRPRENHNVRIESSVLEITPAHTLQWKCDVLDNSVALVSFHEPSDRLRISSSFSTVIASSSVTAESRPNKLRYEYNTPPMAMPAKISNSHFAGRARRCQAPNSRIDSAATQNATVHLGT